MAFATWQKVSLQRIVNRFLASRIAQEDQDDDDEYGNAGIGFEIVGSIRNVEDIAWANEVRDLRWLNATYGIAKWRKRAGVAMVSYNTGETETVELHWYEARGKGRVDVKIKDW